MISTTDNPWLSFLVAGLACYRLALMLSEDKGPFRMFTKLRSFLKREAREHPSVRKSAVHEGVECKRCTSVWMGSPIATYVYLHDQWPVNWWIVAADTFLLCMALSAAAILMHRLLPPK